MDHPGLISGPDEQVPLRLRPQPAKLIRIYVPAALTASMDHGFSTFADFSKSKIAL
ncbi:hypothetical protein THTE_3229 [Thermogutta terrifontis]|uniref:Uncharacterized protein n=1 Tax=Thermogutta terrifontis TaxID=1331910 RepID=A0A286RIN7_9BACT|nr:hypothetical protein THTE_3229 [Thermogutta terrifontis]